MASTGSTSFDEGDSPSLAQQINASIASSHTTVNRLILDRMPRAVPPYTDNPSTYITGLLHIGAVYIAFESLWQNLLGIHSEIAPIPYTFPFNSPNDDDNHQQKQHDAIPQITARTRRVLEQAYSPTLLRAPRIKADVQAMTGWPDHVYEQQLCAAGTSAHLRTLTLHIRDAVTAKPHLLLAYAYTLYLALLSGGSYIRTELMFLDRDFWEATPTPIVPGLVECRPDEGRRRQQRQQSGENGEDEDEDSDAERRLPLDFLDFDPPLGANPRQQTKRLKADFKARFAAADALLAEPERRDIIAEAALIFQHLEGVVAQLDRLFDGDAPRTSPSPAGVKMHAQRALGGVGMRLRDSIAIAKGRLLLRGSSNRRRKSSGTSAVVVPRAGEGLGGSSRPSLVSEGWDEPGEEEGVAQRASGEHDLGRDAVVPREGFRTIRYNSDLARPDRTAAASITRHNRRDGKKEDNDIPMPPHSFDGASDYCCPMSRAPMPMMSTKKGAGVPDYALYAIVSNLVLLGGMMGIFVAWLWVRHGEGNGSIMGL